MLSRKRTLRFTCGILLFGIVALLLSTKGYFNNKRPHDLLWSGSKGGPKIVFWSKPFHPIDWSLPRLRNGDGGCSISFDRKDILHADAVIFFMKSCMPGDRPDPRSRRKDQVYVWWSHESPWTVRNYYKYELTEYDNYFNWTMTFRSDSDVLAPMWPTPALDYLLQRVGRKSDMVNKNFAKTFTMKDEDFQLESHHLLSRKNKFIAWVVSDCNITTGARQRNVVIAKLKEEGGVEIDEFGKCAGKPIPFLFPDILETLSPYKFYLAFENSYHCRDYLTEKTLFNSFASGTVPIIYGPTKKDVQKLLPENSYIFVEDFNNFSDLGRYLQYLNGNVTAYRAYFEWWKTPGAQIYPRFGFNYGPRYLEKQLSGPQFSNRDLQDDWLEYERFGMYHLCRKLKRGDHTSTTKVIRSLANEWYGRENQECLDEEIVRDADFLKNILN